MTDGSVTHWIGQLKEGGERVAEQELWDHYFSRLAAVNEECRLFMDALDEKLRPVARMKLEGYTNGEIAKYLGRVERTVDRKLDRIQHAWLEEVKRS